jgi:hypothetical protein
VVMKKAFVAIVDRNNYVGEDLKRRQKDILRTLQGTDIMSIKFS